MDLIWITNAEDGLNAMSSQMTTVTVGYLICGSAVCQETSFQSYLFRFRKKTDHEILALGKEYTNIDIILCAFGIIMYLGCFRHHYVSERRKI